jgi:hypothetical protein
MAVGDYAKIVSAARQPSQEESQAFRSIPIPKFRAEVLPKMVAAGR